MTAAICGHFKRDQLLRKPLSEPENPSRYNSAGGAAMFTDQIELKDIPKADPEFVDLLKRVVTIQADCETGGPHLYVEAMLPSAPARIDQLVVARTAAEEIDHFRKFARVAGDLGVDTSFILSRPNRERYLEAFRGHITTWE